jgi:pantothenate synthetase
VDAHTLAALDVVEGAAVAVTAVWFGEVRLIDNRLLAP